MPKGARPRVEEPVAPRPWLHAQAQVDEKGDYHYTGHAHVTVAPTPLEAAEKLALVLRRAGWTSAAPGAIRHNVCESREQTPPTYWFWIEAPDNDLSPWQGLRRKGEGAYFVKKRGNK
jgi:hypothetical protein